MDHNARNLLVNRNIKVEMNLNHRY